MEPTAGHTALVDPQLTGVLSSLGLAAEYVRAEGDTLYRLDADGAETPVLDMVGGFGATVLGHNDPRITSYAKALLEERIPVYAQFARQSYAEETARKLDATVRRESGTDEPYAAVFANSGAEAIEVAVKHAEFDRVLRLAALREEIAERVAKARAALDGGTVSLSAAAARLLPPDAADPGAALAAVVEEHNRARAEAPPVLFALRGGFHGKLVGSVQLTHNPAFREPFRALAAQCRFLAPDRPGELAEAVAAERRTLLDVSVDGATVHVADREMPVVCALLLEPVQGEGGIRVLGEEFAREAQRVCAEAGFPLVVDEIQSGMGRTGHFLASTGIGLRGDYYVLAKSLGGGVAKAAVTLVRRSRYRPEFEMAHSSTFAKDGFSTRIAGRVVDVLEADGGEVYRLARERGARLLEALEAVRREFPDVVREVRGRGLMAGLEFHDRGEAASPAVQGYARAGAFGYLAAGFLLRAHAIRVLPTASAAYTLRFEPSVHLGDEAVERVAGALRELCTVLRDGDDARLLGPREE